MTKVIHIHYMAPTFYVSRLDNQRYLIPGWIPVSEDTVIEDVLWINPYEKKSNKKIEIQGKEWNFESSSSPGQYYTVRVVNDSVTCTCPGSWRSKDRQCKHIKSVKKELSVNNP